MQNLNPEQMKGLFDQMSKMSEEEIQQISKQTGMNLTPEMLKQATNLFKNMSGDQLSDMIKNHPSANQNTGGTQPQVPIQNAQQKPSTASKSLFPEIEKSKLDGNEKFKKNDYDMAITNYLEAIISIEDEKENPLTEQQQSELKQLEIDCRNNLATVKSKINDYHSLIIHSEAVLKLDPNNLKATFRLGQGFHGMKRFEKGYEYLKKAKEAAPDNQTYVELFKKCEEDLEQQRKEGKKDEEPNFNMNKFNQKMGMGQLFEFQ